MLSHYNNETPRLYFANATCRLQPLKILKIEKFVPELNLKLHLLNEILKQHNGNGNGNGIGMFVNH